MFCTQRCSLADPVDTLAIDCQIWSRISDGKREGVGMHREKAIKDAKVKKVTSLSYRANEVGYSTGKELLPMAERYRLTAPFQTGLLTANLTKKNSIKVIKVTGMRKLVTTQKGSRIFSNKDWDTFFHLTDNPPRPAPALREAYRTYKEQFDSEE